MNTYVVEKTGGELILTAAETPETAKRYGDGVNASLVLDDSLRQVYRDYKNASGIGDTESELSCLTSLLEMLEGFFPK